MTRFWSSKGMNKRQWVQVMHRRFSSLKWKPWEFQKWIADDVVFKIVYVVEAVVLVSTLCVFYLCCGCHFR